MLSDNRSTHVERLKKELSVKKLRDEENKRIKEKFARPRPKEYSRHAYKISQNKIKDESYTNYKTFRLVKAKGDRWSEVLSSKNIAAGLTLKNDPVDFSKYMLPEDQQKTR